MSDCIAITGRIDALDRGRSTCTIVRLPAEAAARLAAEGARRVEGEIVEHPGNHTPTRAAVIGEPLLWAGRSLLDRIGLAPGDAVEVPEDLAATLRASGASHLWEPLTPGRRRGMIYRIGTAKSQATRDRWIVRLLGEIGDPA